MFHSSGDHFWNGFKSAFKHMTSWTTFSKKDILCLHYDSASLTLILLNETSKKESWMPFRAVNGKLDYIMPCIWLPGFGNKIEYLTNHLVV